MPQTSAGLLGGRGYIGLAGEREGSLGGSECPNKQNADSRSSGSTVSAIGEELYSVSDRQQALSSGQMVLLSLWRQRGPDRGEDSQSRRVKISCEATTDLDLPSERGIPLVQATEASKEDNARVDDDQTLPVLTDLGGFRGAEDDSTNIS